LSVARPTRQQLATLEMPVTSARDATLLAERVRDLLLLLPLKAPPEISSKGERPPPAA
jgi:hypothetical protein